MQNNKLKASAASILLVLAGTTASGYPNSLFADGGKGTGTAPLAEDIPYLFVVHQGRSIKIIRDLNKAFKVPSNIRNSLAYNAEVCPPFCLRPLKTDDLPVESVSEAEIVNFMATHLRDNTGILIDVRNASYYSASTIPGSVNYFIQTIQKGPGDTEFDAILETLGAKRRGEVSWLNQQLENFGLTGSSEVTADWDFTKAKHLIIWAQSQTDKSPLQAIRVLLDAGYPAHKIRWYHGGITSWTFWGFTIYSAPKKY